MAQNFWQKLVPTDLIAIIIIVGSLILKFKGMDGTVSVLLISVVFYYFGKKNEVLKALINSPGDDLKIQ